MYDFRGKRILIADNNAYWQEKLENILAQTGACIVKAKDGREVVKTVENSLNMYDTQIHLVLMSMQMPLMDGIAVTRRLRSQEIYTPIIMQVSDMPDSISKSMNAGCTDNVTRPYSTTSLLSKIGYYLKR
jgi:CheY-like chemotaxis protein